VLSIWADAISRLFMKIIWLGHSSFRIEWGG